MMAHFVRFAVLALVSFACVTPAEANWVAEVFRGIARDTKRRNCWPKPFDGPDRHSVWAPYGVMVSNGWRRQNMLGDHHFVETTQELTEAAELKIRWILTEAPRQHRMIYVHRGESRDATAVRIDHVQQLVARLAPEGELPPVLETDIPDWGWPASEVDLIGRKYEASIPEPRLPVMQDAGVGGD